MKNMHLGLMVPANNTTFENEIMEWLPAGYKVTTVKIPRGAAIMTPETIPQYNASALNAAEIFCSLDVDRILYGCTAAGFFGGPSADHQIREDLVKLTGKPVTSTANSMCESLREAGVKKLSLVTPYPEWLNIKLEQYLYEEGFEVDKIDSFFVSSVEELGRINSDQVFEMALRTSSENCEGLFIACAQLPTAKILEKLRITLKKPVFSSNASCVHQALTKEVEALV